MTNDVIELRLPPKTQFLPVLRAMIGVIAGGASFDYDQIIQLRTAVAEAFEIAIGCVSEGDDTPPREVVVRFFISTGRVDVLVASSGEYRPPPGGEEGLEIQALLKSLVDEFEIGSGAAGTPIVRMAKYK